MQKPNLEKILKILLSAFLFLLPLQTVYIFREVFLGSTKIEYWTLNFYVTEILLWLVVVLFIVWYWKRFRVQDLKLKFSFSKDRIFVFSCLLFIIYHLSSIIWSSDKSLALQQSLHIIEAFLLFFILFLGPLKFGEAVKWMMFGVIVPSVLGIWQFLTQTTFSSTLLGLTQHVASESGSSVVVGEKIGRWLRAYGTFSHPNVFGGYLILVLILFISYVLDGKNKLKYKKLLSVICYLLSVSLFFTFSRSAWLVGLIVILSYCYIVIKKKSGIRFIIYNLSFIIILTALFFPIVQTRLLGSSSNEVASVTERVSGYNEALRIFKQHPLFGIGAGNYTRAEWHVDKWQESWQIQPVHNVGLLMLAELGVIGLLLFLFIVYSFIRLFVAVIKSDRVSTLSIGSFGLSLVAYCLLLSFDHYLYTSYVGLALSGIYWGLLARDLHS